MALSSSAKTPPDGTHATQVEMRGEKVAFEPEEAIRRVDHVPTPKDIVEQTRSSGYGPKPWDDIPTRLPRLRIKEYTRACRRGLRRQPVKGIPGSRDGKSVVAPTGFEPVFQP